MDAINEMLDKARKACGVDSDNALSKHLGVTRATVSGWRKGKSMPDVVACDKIAKMIGEKPLFVIAQVSEMRAISTAEKAVWRRLASAAIVVLSLLPMVPVSATVRPALTEAGYMHYAKFIVYADDGVT